jgi:ataxia telangiectasia mutated family protein
LFPGDRHVQNILIDQKTAELIHIDLGIAFEQVI